MGADIAGRGPSRPRSQLAAMDGHVERESESSPSSLDPLYLARLVAKRDTGRAIEI